MPCLHLQIELHHFLQWKDASLEENYYWLTILVTLTLLYYVFQMSQYRFTFKTQMLQPINCCKIPTFEWNWIGVFFATITAQFWIWVKLLTLRDCLKYCINYKTIIAQVEQWTRLWHPNTRCSDSWGENRYVFVTSCSGLSSSGTEYRIKMQGLNGKTDVSLLTAWTAIYGKLSFMLSSPLLLVQSKVLQNAKMLQQIMENMEYGIHKSV